MYDEREYDASLPDTATEELLACIHILYRLSGYIDRQNAYKFVDGFLMDHCTELDGVVPIEMIINGEGVIVLEYLRDVELQAGVLSGRGPN